MSRFTTLLEQSKDPVEFILDGDWDIPDIKELKQCWKELFDECGNILHTAYLAAPKPLLFIRKLSRGNTWLLNTYVKNKIDKHTAVGIGIGSVLGISSALVTGSSVITTIGAGVAGGLGIGLGVKLYKKIRGRK